MGPVELHPDRLGRGVEQFCDLDRSEPSGVPEDHDGPLLLGELGQQVEELDQVVVDA